MKQGSQDLIFAALRCRFHLFHMASVFQIRVPECLGHLASAWVTLFVIGFLLMPLIERPGEDAAHLQPLLGYLGRIVGRFPGDQE